MIRKTILAFTATVIGSACGQDLPPTDRVARDVAYLAADEQEGRGVGTAGLDRAADYIADAFGQIGLDPAFAAGFFQDFVIDPTAPAAAHSGLGGSAVRNVAAVIPGRGELAGQVVVIGAHYDHLGLGGPGSLEPDSMGVVHNGADDNASGTAALLEAARRLRDRRAEHVRTLAFVAFTAEELGLIGSAHYAANPAHPIDSTFAMVNMDMVGRLRDDRVAAFGAESAEEFPALLDSLNATYSMDLSSSGDGFGRSDHQSFYVEGVPVIHLFTNTHEQYHKTSDDADLINNEGVARVASFAADLAWVLATRTEPLTFVEAEPEPVITSTGERPYLGSIPDMTSSPGGVLLSGVTPGSPADEAGLQKGDILVGLGEHDIGDLYDMTNALNAHKPGDVVTLRVRRGETVLELTATLRRRGG